MMFTKEDIKKQLEQMGAPKRGVVTVHSSLRAVGQTQGRGEGLLEALIEYFTQDGGLLVIPTHTWNNFFNGSQFNLDMTDSKTCIGTLPDIAAAHPDAHRSQHPTHSVAVFGDSQRAEEFISADLNAPTCTNPAGCYGRIHDLGGSVLLIGVGQNRNTYIHCVEEMLGVENRTGDTLSPVRIRLKDGTVRESEIRFMEAKGLGDVSARFPKLEPAFRYHGCIRDGFVGNAEAMLCDAVGMKKVMQTILERSGGRELLADDTPLSADLYLNR